MTGVDIVRSKNTPYVLILSIFLMFSTLVCNVNSTQPVSSSGTGLDEEKGVPIATGILAGWMCITLISTIIFQVIHVILM